MADPTAYADGYPVALTRDERAEMDRRIAMEDEMNPLEDLARGLPSFAGVWIDQPNGGIIKVAFAGDADQHRAAIQALAPPGSTVDVVDVRYSMAELEAVLARVEDARIQLKAEGIWVRELGIDPEPNRVELAVADLTDAAVAELHARFGDGIIVEQSGNPTFTGCIDRYHCVGPPIRAGIAAPTNAYVPCSLGFLVRAWGAVGWLTAGHCAPNVGAVWAHDGINIGTIRATCWPHCNYSDAARAGELNANFSSFHVYNGPNSRVAVTASQCTNCDLKGDYTCLNARRTAGWRCGTINDIRRVDYGNVYFWEQRYATFPAYNGDSGGAVHSHIINYGVRAHGIQSGCEDWGGAPGCEPGDGRLNGRAIYSHIARVSQELGVTVCTSSAPCP
jgi:hypothetical protein